MIEETKDLYGYEIILKNIAQNGLANQQKKNSDYIGDDGMLMCGICNKPRQMIRAFNTSTNDRVIHLKTTCDCDCDKKIKAEENESLEQRKREEKLKWKLEYSEMDRRYSDASFDKYIESYKDNNYSIVKKYAENFKDMTKGKLKFISNGHSYTMPVNQGLILYGDVGTGKTYSAACIANYLMRNGSTVYMTTLTKILDDISSNRDREKEIVTKIEQADLVIFDDFGAERNTSYALEKVFNYIDMRYKLVKPMIITTNIDMNDIGQEVDISYQRLYDRILQTCTPIRYEGMSRRNNLKKSMAIADFFNGG